MIYLEVAVAAPLMHTLTYSAQVSAAGQLFPGIRILVPLGKRVITGYLLGFTTHPIQSVQIRPISDILDTEPLFPENMVSFFRWIADYYHYPIGQVIQTSLPCGLSPRIGSRIHLTDQGRDFILQLLASDTDPGYSWLPCLLSKRTITPAAERRIRRTGEKKILMQWEERGHLEISPELTGATTRTRTEVCVQPVFTPDKPPSQMSLTTQEQKTLQIISGIQPAGPDGSIPRKDVIRLYSGAGKGLKSLEQKGLIKLEERAVMRDPFGVLPPFYHEPEQLTDEQVLALEQIIPAIREKKFETFLLHGVTGSGKTEVYLKATAAALAESKSVLILVPEIALATQLEGHFYSRFRDKVALLHSGLTQGERFDQWMRIARGLASVVIGARSAIFAPLRNPGLIIVDEEHDGTYKQEDGLRYQGRDLAVLRASMSGIPVILGSATPSVTSYQHTFTGKYKLLALTRRIYDRQLPDVTIVDLRKLRTTSGNPPLFSPELTAAIRENLSQGNQSLIFLNRRGYANLMLCQDCGNTVQCPNCRITLTLHKARSELICHYCGHTTTSSILCSVCRSTRLVGIGFGTERIESELASNFPQASIARLDRDTAVRRQDYLTILDAVRRREIDILVGTQMITKGHHFTDVTLVGIIWADAGLGMPDFKAGERTFQLLSQVTGRAGRGDKPGRVIIQTYQPDHYSVVTARNHDYLTLFNTEKKLRASLGFPPFSRIINLRLEGEDEDMVRSSAVLLSQTAAQQIDRKRTVSVLGPAPAPLSRLRGKYRWQLMLKSTSRKDLHALCKWLIQTPPPRIKSRAVKLSVDVDPENML